MKRLGRVVELQREVQELYQSYQVLSVRENVVQLFSGYFLDIFDGYEIVDFDEDYDELVAYCDGIRFITLVDKKNHIKPNGFNHIQCVDVVDYIIKKVQVETSSFQYCISYDEIERALGTDFNKREYLEIIKEIESRSEVADLYVDESGFDIVLYTAYSPNYKGEDCY